MNFRNFATLLLVAFLILVAPIVKSATETSTNGTSTLAFDDNIATPAISNKQSPAVRRHIETIRKKFAEKGLDTRTVRNDEVMVVTIPTDRLFQAGGSSELRPEAVTILNYFKQAVNHPESYRLVIAVYADDTGDSQYSRALTRRRAMALKPAMDHIAETIPTPNIDYYWMGNTNFLYPNNSIANRSKNRRVDIYIVPEAHIISLSQPK